MSNKWIDDLEWKNPPKQNRSQRTRDALLDAAERLFGQNGAEATSVTDIAKASGCTIGALYHHFKDKAALQEALFARGLQRLEHSSQLALDPDRWQDASILDLLRGYIEFSLQVERESPGFKVAIKEAVKSRPDLRELLTGAEQKMYDKFRGLLMLRAGTIGHPEPEIATRFVVDQCKAMILLRCDRTIQFDQLKNVSDNAFVEEFLRSAARYLELS